MFDCMYSVHYSTEMIFKICDNIQFKDYNSIFNVIVNRTLWIMFSSLNFISAIQSPSMAWMIQCLSILRQNVSKIIHTVQLRKDCTYKYCVTKCPSLFHIIQFHLASLFSNKKGFCTRVPIRNFKWLSALRAIYIFLSQFVIAHLFFISIS